MKTSTTTDLIPYNKVVKEAYQATYKKARQLLSNIEQEELRYSLERECRTVKPDTVIHEFVSPLIYLRLECDQQGLLCIHWGFEEVMNDERYSNLTAEFLRVLYHNTDKSNTAIDIEASVKTNWLIKTCSEMYEYLEERNKHHTFKQIAYKPASVKRKLKAVA
ncbi:hypothetical protein C8P68_104325 [Mucilaginibacter yixingensis]|uniref:Uncharacterized protein n=1 Tax=Mucilaginibacter yixingensis TaxID=1295612 RepID=A0A2T5J9X4_9SPHI|nr:hypothetical protein [Mucilaginibacter yixingensis]PTQ96834.1 hypothetical protein C8P68_104325 [Mucilaginibacter yixingensis]